MNQQELRNLILGTTLIVSFFITFTLVTDKIEALGTKNQWWYQVDIYPDHQPTFNYYIYLPVILIPSPLTISNLAVKFTGVNNCTTKEGFKGSSQEITFNYDDPEGKVVSGSVILFYTSATSDIPIEISIDDSFRVTVSGNSYIGTIKLGPFCAKGTNISLKIQLKNSIGGLSNEQTIYFSSPSTAQEKDMILDTEIEN